MRLISEPQDNHKITRIFGDRDVEMQEERSPGTESEGGGEPAFTGSATIKVQNTAVKNTNVLYTITDRLGCNLE